MHNPRPPSIYPEINHAPGTIWRQYADLVIAGADRYDAWLQIRQGGSGTYTREPTLGDPSRRWISRDHTLILDVRADIRHVSWIR